MWNSQNDSPMFRRLARHVFEVGPRCEVASRITRRVPAYVVVAAKWNRLSLQRFSILLMSVKHATIKIRVVGPAVVHKDRLGSGDHIVGVDVGDGEVAHGL